MKIKSKKKRWGHIIHKYIFSGIFTQFKKNKLLFETERLQKKTFEN